MPLLYITVKLVTAYFGLWAMTRFLGKKEISQLTPFDFVSSLILSELVGNTIYDDDVHLSHLLYALALWTVLSFVIEKIAYKNRRLREPLDGKAAILIENGAVDLHEMKRNNLDFDQLLMMLRGQGVFALREVAFAVFETNGSLSVLKKPRYDTVTREDLELPEEKLELPVIVIEDGAVLKRNLAKTGWDEPRLLEELRKLGFDSPRAVAFADWKSKDGLYAVGREPASR